MHPLRKLILDHAEQVVASLRSVDPTYNARFRQDAGESAFLSRQLEHVRAQAFNVRYPELKGRRFVPVLTAMNPGAEDYRYKWFDEVAKAEIVKTLGPFGPRAEVYAQEATARVRSITASYAWNIQELRAMMLAGEDIGAKKATAARKAIERTIDTLLLVGDGDIQSPNSASGLFNLSGTNTFTTTTGALGSTAWASKSSDEILDDLFGIEEKIYVDTNELEQPDMLILPIQQEAIISRKRMGDGDTSTVKDYFLKHSKFIKTIDTSLKLATAGSGSTTRMVAYKRDPDVLEALLPVEFEQFAPQWVGYESITGCHARCGGVVLYLPKAVCYADGI